MNGTKNDEEEVVLVELTGIIDSDFLEKGDGACKLLGVDTENPVLQIGQCVFTGEYTDMLGTAVLFEKVKPSTKRSTRSGVVPEDQNEALRFQFVTRKKLSMKRVFLTKN